MRVSDSPKQLASSFALAVTRESAEPKAWIARKGRHSLQDTLEKIIPQASTNLSFHIEACLFINPLFVVDFIDRQREKEPYQDEDCNSSFPESSGNYLPLPTHSHKAPRNGEVVLPHYQLCFILNCLLLRFMYSGSPEVYFSEIAAGFGLRIQMTEVNLNTISRTYVHSFLVSPNVLCQCSWIRSTKFPHLGVR
mmetsp:Transcript_58789/g.155648  ORF Transcript_58789/g.155648 Transcript_58789/m.155648 type:complete len:194 (-) Transcript_58789:684-1265(-)